MGDEGNQGRIPRQKMKIIAEKRKTKDQRPKIKKKDKKLAPPSPLRKK